MQSPLNSYAHRFAAQSAPLQPLGHWHWRAQQTAGRRHRCIGVQAADESASASTSSSTERAAKASGPHANGHGRLRLRQAERGAARIQLAPHGRRRAGEDARSFRCAAATSRMALEHVRDMHSYQPVHECTSSQRPAGSTALTLRVPGATAPLACGLALPLCMPTHACMRVDGMRVRMRRFWHDEKRFKGTGEDSLVQQELLRTGAPHHMATATMAPMGHAWMHPAACMLRSLCYNFQLNEFWQPGCYNAVACSSTTAFVMQCF